MTAPAWRSEKPDGPGLWEARLEQLSFAPCVRFLVFQKDGALWYASPRNQEKARPLDEIPDHSLRRWRGPLVDGELDRE